jgi:putative peptidoglycan lipid II flippase
MVSLASLDFPELGRCLLAAVTGGAAVWVIFSFGVVRAAALLGHKAHHASRGLDLVVLVLGSLLWVVIAKTVLEKSGSALPRVAMRRLRMG